MRGTCVPPVLIISVSYLHTAPKAPKAPEAPIRGQCKNDILTMKPASKAEVKP